MPANNNPMQGMGRRIRLGDKVFIQGMPVMALEVIDASDPALIVLRSPNGATLRKMADRIQARAIRRCGELLKQIDKAKPGPKLNGGTPIQLSPRRQAMKDADISPGQGKQAMKAGRKAVIRVEESAKLP
jgi:hypothetical protein